VTDATENCGSPTPLVRVGRLNSLRSVRRELARLYWDLRNDRVAPRVAGTAAYILTAITKAVEVELLEGRIQALEVVAGVSKRTSRVRMVGHARH
jgi:hypothetical protein